MDEITFHNNVGLCAPADVAFQEWPQSVENVQGDICGSDKKSLINMEELMSEGYRKFNADDYIETEEDIEGLLRAAEEEGPGDGAVMRAALKHVARTRNMSARSRDAMLNRGNF